MTGHRRDGREDDLIAKASATLDACDFDVRRDVGMILSRIDEEDGRDLPAILEVAARLAEGSSVEGLSVQAHDRRAVRTVAEYVRSFAPGEASRGELVAVAGALRALVTSLEGVGEGRRPTAIRAAVRLSQHGRVGDPALPDFGDVLVPGTATGPDGRPTVTLWRPVGPAELAIMREGGMRGFPPRLPEQPIFYPVLSEDYATRIARDWNVREDGGGHVTRFDVEAWVLDRHPVHDAGGRGMLELWVPAEELEAFNRAIVGGIEVVASYLPDASPSPR